MYFSSKLTIGRVLAVALAITLWGFGVSGLQARERQKSCSTEVKQTCSVAPQACTTCPIDPHAQHEADEARERALAKEQKAAAHAQHEAEEARAREQKEAEHAQHEAAEACARQQKEYAHAQHEADEAQERANAKLAKATQLRGMCRATSC
jgi:FtsZ-interacting cell division protein ZipA